MNRRRSFINGRATAFLVTLTLTILAACVNRPGKDDTDGQARAMKEPAEISVENGQTILALDSAAQNRLGLEVATLTPSVTREQILAPAVVLSTQDLATLRNSYLAAQVQVEKSRIEGGVTRKEYARLKTLFEENQNISEKVLQSAEATLRANQADVRTGEQQLNLQESIARQEWGSVVATWVVGGSPQLQGIFEQREVFVQMTLSAGATFGPPKTVSLEISDYNRAQGSFVSPLPRVDPRIQGRSYLYLAPAHSGFSPGVNLVAHFSIGNQMTGVIVPTSAVVWSEGNAWVYEQTGPGRYTLRAVSTDTPVEKGFFVATGLPVGVKVVTQGAQALLSEQLLLRGQQGAEPDVD
jgi:hypothetical protein